MFASPPSAAVVARPSSRSSATRSPSMATPRMRQSVYPRTWALARRLSASSRTPYEYVRRLLAYLADGFAYSESPLQRGCPWRASCSTTASATASSSRARWRCCCAWAACPRGWWRVLSRQLQRQARRLRGPRHRRPLLGGGVVPRVRLGDVRPDAAGLPGALAAHQPRSPGRDGAGGAGRPAADARRPARAGAAGDGRRGLGMASAPRGSRRCSPRRRPWPVSAPGGAPRAPARGPRMGRG